MNLTPEIIKICRMTLGLSQGKLAREADISCTLLGSIEREERPLLPHVSKKIRQAIPYSDEQITELIGTVHRINKT
ncbi:hypothetical protein SAMN04488601_10347 [Paenibacillus sp. 453mf]|nr:hypothetical protein SAMN04488601_10347 [Paenibacillus sp. 453mf]